MNAVEAARALARDREAERAYAEVWLAAQADAEQRLGRPLTDGEKRIDIVGLDRDLADGKARLLRAIQDEQARAAKAYAVNSSRGVQIKLTPAIRDALASLYADGVKHARAELVRAGFNPDTFARKMAATALHPRLVQIEDEMSGRLDELSKRLEHRTAIAVDLSALTTSKIAAAVRSLPGALSIAADFTTPAAYAGLGSVWDEADAAGITTSWTYTAVMDAATCDPCAAMDGTSYDSWEAVQADLPDGGPYVDCDGGDRCRCRAVPEFDSGGGGGDTGAGGGLGGDLGPSVDELAPIDEATAAAQISTSIPGVEPLTSEAAPAAPGPSLEVPSAPAFPVGPSLGDLMPGAPQDVLDAVAEKQDLNVRTYAMLDGVSVEKWRATAEQAIADAVANPTIRVRVSPKALHQILDDGRFKSQFETQTSGGSLSPEYRAHVESKMFGYPEDLAPSQRPIYGYLAGSAKETGVVNQYGSIVVHLNEATHERTTFSLADSLGPGDREMIAPSSLLSPSLNSWTGDTGIAEGTSLSEMSDYYAEAQIHGGVELADVREVVFDLQAEQEFVNYATKYAEKTATELRRRKELFDANPTTDEHALFERETELARLQGSADFYARLKEEAEQMGTLLRYRLQTAGIPWREIADVTRLDSK